MASKEKRRTTCVLQSHSTEVPPHLLYPVQKVENIGDAHSLNRLDSPAIVPQEPPLHRDQPPSIQSSAIPAIGLQTRLRTRRTPGKLALFTHALSACTISLPAVMVRMVELEWIRPVAERVWP